MKDEYLLENIKYCKCEQRATFEVKIMDKNVPMCSTCANKRPQNERKLL